MRGIQLSQNKYIIFFLSFPAEEKVNHLWGIIETVKQNREILKNVVEASLFI